MDRVLVVPGDKRLLGELQGQTVAIRVSSVPAARDAIRVAGDNGVRIYGIIIEWDKPASLLDLDEETIEPPIMLFADRMGRLPDLVRRLPVIRNHSIRVFLPADRHENITDIRILASLGISAGISFRTSGKIKWESLVDLVSYEYFPLVMHAPIAPLDYFALHYMPDKRTSMDSVYFENPAEFIHLDEKGRVALTSRKLEGEKFIAESLGELEKSGTVEENPEYLDHFEKWRGEFLKQDGCAYCPAWRICLGRFPEYLEDAEPGCRAFFSEIMEAIEIKQQAPPGSP